MEISEFALFGGAVAASMLLYLIYRTLKGWSRRGPPDDEEPREL